MTTDAIQSVLLRARDAVLRAIAEPDLEGYLCALLLRRERPEWASAALAKLFAAPAPVPSRPVDVAVLGIRRALGLDVGDATTLASSLRRELSRAPLPPAPRAHDDERLMLGVAAGVSGVPEVRAQFADALSVAGGRSVRWSAVAMYSRWLSGTTPDAKLAEDTSELIVGAAKAAGSFDDAAALLGLSAELLDTTQWSPDDKQLEAFDDALRTLRAAIVLDAPAEFAPLTSAMVLRGLAYAASERLVRRSMLQGTLATIDAFPAVAQLLAKPSRNGASISLSDEYDLQWLFQALLIPVIPDLVAEDPAPRLAGASSRLDFTSRNARLGIELKYVHKKSAVAKMRDELLIDERQYQEHPYVDTVVAFVHDPHGHMPLADRPAFERDLSCPVSVNGRTVMYFTRVR